jgi:hypothetical protein
MIRESKRTFASPFSSKVILDLSLSMVTHPRGYQSSFTFPTIVVMLLKSRLSKDVEAAVVGLKPHGD